ncbi:MAG: hypothetical protein GY710_22255 [Desulfobacteraceae bacterium]|nr:hypothetical protein [Desulfobacteraceae bacterium]
MVSKLSKKLAKLIVVTSLVLVVSSCFAAPGFCGRQPKMNNSIALLKAAKRELQEAFNNKGGHKAKAIALIEQAIKEVKRGKAAAHR